MIILKRKNTDIPVCFKLVSSDITFEPRISGGIIMLYAKGIKRTYPVWIYPGEILTIGQTTITIPSMHTEKTAEDFINTIKIPVYNEYISQTLENI